LRIGNSFIKSIKSLPKWAIILSILTMLVLFAGAAVAFANDPTGAATSGKEMYKTVFPGMAIKEAIGKSAASMNFVWTLLGGFLVFFMIAGFALLETGFCRAKNALHTMMMNLVVSLVGGIGWYIAGFALMFGGLGGIVTLGGGTELNGLFEITKGWGLFGTKGFFLLGTYSVSIYAFWFFQLVFMDTAATIPTGPLAERWKFVSFIIFSFLMATIIYPLFGNWVWGGGWLSALGRNLGLGHGFVDFAGSSVVHTIGGLSGLAGAMILGPRIGKFNKDGSPNAIPGHHLPMALLGTIILFFGWFGFNPGSTLAATDLRIAVVVVNTLLAGCFGGVTTMLVMWKMFGKPDASMTANGLLAGLVAVTAPCAFIEAWAAVIIGIVAGIIVVVAVLFVERVLKVDDPVGAVAVHGANGLWGVLSLGLFADGTYGVGWNGVGAEAAKGVTGLFYGDASQLVAQLIGIATAIVWGFGLSYLIFKAIDKVVGLRVAPEEEIQGLDFPEIGALAYPDFSLVTGPRAEDIIVNDAAASAKRS